MTTIACDIGGTNIKGALFQNETIVRTVSLPTDQTNGKQSTMTVLHEVIQQLWEPSVEQIGIVTAGAVDPSTGMIVGNTGTLQGWVGFSIKEELFETFGVPCVVENDANGAMVAEMQPYLKQGIKHAVMLTLGTGVGTAVYINGDLYRGHHYQVEFGHMLLHPNGRPCTCGMEGCAEQYLSGSALTKAAQKRVNASITHGAELFDYLDQDDPNAKILIEEYLDDLMLYLHNIERTYDPEMIIIGGGVSNLKERFLHLVQERQRKTSFKANIVLASNGNQAGILGAFYITQSR
jgi:glucokinase